MTAFASLGSGSRGNGTLVEIGGELILVDCGFTLKQAERRMARLAVRPGDLSAILVTHEHSDHASGVAALSHKYAVPVHASFGTLKATGWRMRGEVFDSHVPFRIGAVTVSPVIVPHDAREPTQFTFEHGGVRLGVVSDLGHVTPFVCRQFRHCDGLLMESNHDVPMLLRGRYPESVKRRIASNLGHLSNEQAAAFLAEVAHPDLQVVVGHVSEQNNHPELLHAAFEAHRNRVAELSFASQSRGADWTVVTAPLRGIGGPLCGTSFFLCGRSTALSGRGLLLCGSGLPAAIPLLTPPDPARCSVATGRRLSAPAHRCAIGWSTEETPMTAATYFRAQAYNNAWANHRLLTACEALSAEELLAERTSFFPSIIHTLNHVLTVDWFYVSGLEGASLGVAAFQPEIPCPDVTDLVREQRAVDRRLVDVCERLDDAALAATADLIRRDWVQTERTDRILLHLFQHQIHHRGQVHAMLAGTGVEPPQLDEFFLDAAQERRLRADDFAALGFQEDMIWR